MYVTQLDIINVRHLSNITIPISESQKKHLILTGRNGSGKTSVLDALTDVFIKMMETMEALESEGELASKKEVVLVEQSDDISHAKYIKANRRVTLGDLNLVYREICPHFSDDAVEMFRKYRNGEFILASYGAVRKFQADRPAHVEKIELETFYDANERPGESFLKYILDVRVTQALASAGGKSEKAKEIGEWFQKLEHLLKELLDNDSASLEFNEDTFEFHVREEGREPFNLNQLADGYSAMLEIVADLMLRMQKKAGMTFCYNIPGIVLIDEIETHLHLSLQKKVMNFLTGLFPGLQFIVTTHSPFILNSTENAVIYDLENHILVNEGLTDIPYEGVVEGYFQVDALSAMLRDKYTKFMDLTSRSDLSDDELEEISRLEIFLDEIPDYLALDITTEYKKRKLEFEMREDGSWSK